METKLPQTWIEKLEGMPVAGSLPVDKEQSVYTAMRRIKQKTIEHNKTADEENQLPLKKFTIRENPKNKSEQNVFRIN